MDATGQDRELANIAVLTEPVRRRLYLYVAARRERVGREEAARALGITRALAAFHLDRLVAEGLLEADYLRLSDRRGPGAGRPAKVYRRSDREVRITVPPRNYELAARMLIRALEGMGAGGEPGAVATAAREFGAALGAEARRRAGRARSPRRLADALIEVLGEYGFEPCREGDAIGLRNCPFDALSRDHRDLVCGMNLEAMRGAIAALRSSGLEAATDPRPETCCVLFRSAAGSAAATL